MNSRTLGKTGYTVSEIGLGCWQLGGDFGPVSDDTAAEILNTARSLDVNFWDTADVYGGGQSEQRIGAFKDKKNVLVATKLGRGPQFEGMTRYTRAKVKDSLAGSLERLGVEVLDLAQLHCIPIDVLADGEIFTWLDDMRDAGMIRHWGASVADGGGGDAGAPLAHLHGLQTIFNLFRQDAVDTLLPAAQKANVGIIVRLPLASGLLSGKMSKTTTFTDGDHRTYNRDGDAFYVGETFSGLPFDKGVAFADEIKHWLPIRHEPRRSRAALDPRPAGGLDHHRRRHASGPAQGQRGGQPHGPAGPGADRKAQGLLPREGAAGGSGRDLAICVLPNAEHGMRGERRSGRSRRRRPRDAGVWMTPRGSIASQHPPAMTLSQAKRPDCGATRSRRQSHPLDRPSKLRVRPLDYRHTPIE